MNYRTARQILETNSVSTYTEIKRQFRAKALELHPDRNKDRNAAERFCNLVRAYKFLMGYRSPFQSERYKHKGSRGGKWRRSGLFALMRLCLFIAMARDLQATDVLLSWSANTEADLAGYKAYYGLASRSYGGGIPVAANQTGTLLTGLGSGTYYFAVTAYDTAGLESEYSTEVALLLGPPAPPPPQSVCPCTIWPATATPATSADSDSNAVELGVKFRSDINGFIAGIRFYKGTGNTGTHVGNLWTTGGTKLAGVTFTNETASGWQQVLFSSPVSITANTTYIASYHAPNGRYAVTNGYFTTGNGASGIDNPPLHALANSASANGVFLYGSGGFPNQTWQGSNYWVDVVFDTSAPIALPTVTFSDSPASITSGQTATLTWSTTNATSVSINQGVGTVALSGTQAVTPTATTIYTLTAVGSGGTSTASTTVTVTAPAPSGPAVTLNAPANRNLQVTRRSGNTNNNLPITINKDDCLTYNGVKVAGGLNCP